jgi:hypothetical protein
LRREASTPVTAKRFSSDDSAMADALRGDRRKENNVFTVMRQDCIDVMPVPGINPVCGERFSETA